INIIPFPAFDGGHLLFVLIEAIRRKPMNAQIENTVHLIGFILIFLLMIVITITTVVFILGFVDKGNDGKDTKKADIVYSINDIPDNMKNIASLSTRQQDIICAVSKGLIEIDSQGNMIPALAKSVETTDDGIQYNFTIREDVFWSDGKTITADDLVQFFREILTEEDENNIEPLMSVYGARAYLNNEGNFKETVAIWAEGNNLIMRLNSIDNDFLVELSKPQYRLRKNVLSWEFINNNYDSLVYSGDYYIASMNDNEMILHRSEKSNKDIPKVLSIVEDKSEDIALAAFEVGNRDIVVNPPRNQLQRLKNEKKLITMPSDEAVYASFNLDESSIPINGRKKIYSLLNSAIRDYIENNESSMICAEGKYYRSEDSSATKLQERKVLTNADNSWDDEESISIVAENNVDNKELINIISSWIEENTGYTLIVKLVDKDDIEGIIDEGYYDLIIFNSEVKNENDVYSVIDEYNEDLCIETWQEEDYLKIEDDMFNSYSILPILFYNENIAVNDAITGVVLDCNGNINFSVIRK
ncbi:MAG: ABC transporter substrate-binding protein, partial [Clostridium sp.]|nr:ABC transporter substrate-binding protein [Clostridium sp.]